MSGHLKVPVVKSPLTGVPRTDATNVVPDGRVGVPERFTAVPPIFNNEAVPVNPAPDPEKHVALIEPGVNVIPGTVVVSFNTDLDTIVPALADTLAA